MTEDWQKPRITKGFAPFAPQEEQVGARRRYELIYLGATPQDEEPYDMDNVRIVTPKNNAELNSSPVNSDVKRSDRKAQDCTEQEFLNLLRKIEACDFETEEEDDLAADEFVSLAEHPEGTDLLFYPDPDMPHTPESVLATVKAWRSTHGKPGFKPPTN